MVLPLKVLLPWLCNLKIVSQSDEHHSISDFDVKQPLEIVRASSWEDDLASLGVMAAPHDYHCLLNQGTTPAPC